MAATNGHLRPADALMTPIVAETLDALPLTPQDAAAARLARRYAEAIDASEDPEEALKELGPKLLAALVALGATPSGRKGLKAGGASVVGSRLQAVRDRRTG